MNFDWYAAKAEEFAVIAGDKAKVRDGDFLELGVSAVAEMRLQALDLPKLNPEQRAKEVKRRAKKLKEQWEGSRDRDKVAAWRGELPGMVSLMERPPCVADLGWLPGPAWLMKIQFMLEQPALTRNDWAATPVELALRRDRVTGAPMMAATGWKGAFSGALEALKRGRRDKERVDPVANRLLGRFDPSDDVPGPAGRLHFYPTFFKESDLGMGIMNPQDREKRTGVKRGPVDFEVLEAGTTGELSLLWFAFDAHGLEADEITKQTAKDLALTRAAVSTMLRKTGFGAKVSNGFGVACDQFNDLVAGQPSRFSDWMEAK